MNIGKHLWPLSIILPVCGTAADAGPTNPFVCNATHACWELRLHFDMPPSGKPDVFFNNTITSLPITQVNGTYIVNLPVIGPAGSGHYSFRVSVYREGTAPLVIPLRAPTYMYTRPLDVSIYLKTPDYAEDTISALVAGTNKKNPEYWKAFFQGHMLLDTAVDDHNDLLIPEARFAIFLGCQGLARDVRLHLIFDFGGDGNHDECPSTGFEGATAIQLADASVSQWHLFTYAAKTLPLTKAGSPERNALHDTLRWLRDLWPNQRVVFERYCDAHKGDNAKRPFPLSLAQFDHQTGNIAAQETVARVTPKPVCTRKP